MQFFIGMGLGSVIFNEIASAVLKILTPCSGPYCFFAVVLAAAIVDFVVGVGCVVQLWWTGRLAKNMRARQLADAPTEMKEKLLA